MLEADETELASRLALFVQHPAEESTVRPFPMHRDAAWLHKTVEHVATRYRGTTIERVLARRAAQLYRQAVPRSAAIAELEALERAIRDALAHREAPPTGGARHG